jgi:regulator of PEP synthase PpsR (kinase-PPPase family)
MTLQRDLKRARIVLSAAVGRSTRSIAKEVGVQQLDVTRRSIEETAAAVLKLFTGRQRQRLAE